MPDHIIEIRLNERCTRAIHQAVCFTLDKWTGQEEIDQEMMLELKPMLQGCVFEFDFERDRI
tara:strand:+ start:321 stop:506 length:186 start_codon:yes stop_codon:yes gene_type:complete